jgi:hypothetical protein
MGSPISKIYEKTILNLRDFHLDIETEILTTCAQLFKNSKKISSKTI